MKSRQTYRIMKNICGKYMHSVLEYIILSFIFWMISIWQNTFRPTQLNLCHLLPRRVHCVRHSWYQFLYEHNLIGVRYCQVGNFSNLQKCFIPNLQIHCSSLYQLSFFYSQISIRFCHETENISFSSHTVKFLNENSIFLRAQVSNIFIMGIYLMVLLLFPGQKYTPWAACSNTWKWASKI
jgi:hypothetical protein